MMKARMVIDKYNILSDIDPRIYGSFVEHLGRAVYEGIYQPEHYTSDKNGFREDTANLVKELSVPVVRYPGGNFVSGYVWEDGVGPKNERPKRLDYAWKVTETNEFGLNEFMDWCQKVDTTPMMAVNLGTRGLQEAKNLLEYCNHPSGSAMSDLRIKHGYKEPYNINLWCLGNEMDAHWQIGHKTAYEYGRLANEVGTMMKKYDKNLELVACGSSGMGMSTFGSWEREVLDECYDITDYLSLHMYWSNKKDDTKNFLAETIRMEDMINSVVSACDHVKSIKRSKKQINLSFDEWNVWYHAPTESEDIIPWCQHPHKFESVYNFEDALLIGSALITLLRHSNRVKIACLAQLVNVLAPIMTSNKGVWRQTIFYPFLHASRMGRGRALNTLNISPTYECAITDKAPYFDAVVVENEENETLTVFAVNKSQDDEIELVCDMRQFSDYVVTYQTVLTHNDMKAVNTEDAPYEVIPYECISSKNDNGNFSATLSAHSWNVIRLQKKSGVTK